MTTTYYTELGNQLADHITVATYLVMEGHVNSTLAAIKLVDEYDEIVQRGMAVGSFTYYVVNEIMQAMEDDTPYIAPEILDFIED